MLLSCAGVFLAIAVVFGVLAYFRVTPQKLGVAHVSVPLTGTFTVTTPPGPHTSPTGSLGPSTEAVITVTQTQIVAVQPASGGSNLGSIETLASTLATVVAAACAVIALRPQGRGRPPAPAAATAAAADAPAGPPSA